MQKVDLDSMSIDDLAKLRDQASEKLAEKVAARQLELAAEMEKLAAFGGGKKAKAIVPKKDLKDVKEALKPQLQEASKPQATKAA
ncbi:hypothetical protein [Afipia massiliensis]|nr:hypothetical protein [Afipia massiliensis]